MRWLIVLAVLGLAGCAMMERDPRDAPWDPPPGHNLFDQIPNWENEAERRCGGRRSAEERQRYNLSDRC